MQGLSSPCKEDFGKGELACSLIFVKRGWRTVKAWEGVTVFSKSNRGYDAETLGNCTSSKGQNEILGNCKRFKGQNANFRLGLGVGEVVTNSV